MDSNLKRLSMQVNVDDLLPASEKEKEYMVKMRPSTTAFQDGVRRLRKNKVAMVSFWIILLITVASIFLPLFWPYKYESMLGVRPGRPVDASYNNLKPFEYAKSEKTRMEAGEKVFPHVFGTDSSGRDYFIRIVYGTRISLAVGFFASIIVLVIGLLVGSIAGYAGGVVDIIIMRIVDVIYSLPDMLMVILLASVLREPLGKALEGTVLEKIGSNIISLFIIFALLYWVSMSRLIRGERSKGRMGHPQPPDPQLDLRHCYFHSPSDPQRDLYGELPFLPGTGCKRADAVAGITGVRRAQRPQVLPLPSGHSCRRDLADRAVPEPFRRRHAGCL